MVSLKDAHKDVHLRKAAPPIVVRLAATLSSLKDVHSWKTLHPISVRVGGSVISAKDVQCTAGRRPPVQSL